jgi:NAD/NADP transhydrogenase beta subunit
MCNRAALNRIPKYMENPELKKTIENAQRVAASLGNMVVAISQSEAVKAFGKLAEQLSNIKLPQLSEEAKEGLENYHYLNKLESLQLNQ